MSNPVQPIEIRSLSMEEHVAAGIKPTEQLSDEKCTDIEQNSGVGIFTSHGKDGKIRVFIMFGVYFAELDVVNQFNCYFHPGQDYSFCLWGLDEFVHDVLGRAKGIIFWPRTNKYYRVPEWYRAKLPKSLQAFRVLRQITQVTASVSF